VLEGYQGVPAAKGGPRSFGARRLVGVDLLA
jgi:hypothetical protein